MRWSNYIRLLGLTQFSPKWLFLGVFKNSDIVRATRLTLGAVPLKDLVSEEPFLLLCFRFLPFVAEAAGPPPAPPRVMWSRGRGWGLDAGGKAPRGPARWTGTPGWGLPAYAVCSQALCCHSSRHFSSLSAIAWTQRDFVIQIY